MPFLLGIMNGQIDKVNLSFNETEHEFLSAHMLTIQSNTGQKAPESSQVAVLRIHHPIFKYDQFCGPQGTQSMIKLMDQWKQDSSIAGVILDLNSGGGQGSGTGEFAEYLHDYPKPTVSFTKDVVGSAAYYLAAGTDHIIAHKRADFIGSIGAMFYTVNMEGVLKKQGADIYEVYSSLSDQKNIQSRKLKEGDEQLLVQKILDPGAKDFHTDILKYRPQISEKALKGDVFNPSESLSEGLIDSLGTFQDAIDKVFELSNKNKKDETKMSKSYPKIETALNREFGEGETSNGILLTEEEADTVEARMSELEGQLETANTDLQERRDNEQALNDANTSALETINSTLELKGDAKIDSIEKGMSAMVDKINELGQDPGGQHTKAAKKEEGDAKHTYIDFKSPIYNN